MRVLEVEGVRGDRAAGVRSTVLRGAPGFTVGTVDLPPAGGQPPCKMEPRAVLHVLEWEVEAAVDGEGRRRGGGG